MNYSISKSKSLFLRAQNSIPGGVNSPVRAFKSVGGTPLFMKSAKGAYLFDSDGNQYIDYISSWGPMILGHAHEEVINAINEMTKSGISFGAPTELEVLMAELIIEMTQGIEKIRLVSSGTEACMSAVRLARAYTKRNKIIKFEGCYHGHSDAFLVKAGSGLATFNIQTTPGVTAGVSNDTLTAPYNDLQSVNELINNYPDEIAAIIIEPLAGNMGCILPEPEYLQSLRKLCTDHGIVFIFDEVMTGFRLAVGGAQEVFNVHADLVCYGKVIGGGMPMAAFGGIKEIMDLVAPVGNVYQAGTLSGNPIAVISGFTTLNILKNNPEIYKELEEKGVMLKSGLADVMSKKGIPHTVNQFGSMLSLHFGSHHVKDFNSAAACDISMFAKLFHHLLSQGIYLPPSAFESWFLNNALNENDIEKTIHAISTF